MEYNKFSLSLKVTKKPEQAGSSIKIEGVTTNYKKEETPFTIYFQNPRKVQFIEKFVRPEGEFLFEGRLGNHDGRIGLIAFDAHTVRWAPREEAKEQPAVNNVSFDDDDVAF